MFFLISIGSCPLYDPRYKLIDGKCFYFESQLLGYDEANTNCISRLATVGIGKLFEPKDKEQNDKVADVASQTLSGTSVRPHIGITDRVQEGVFAYNSDDTQITFQPEWYKLNGLDDYDCIFMALNQGLGKWSDRPCSEKHPSICESSMYHLNFQPPPI